MSMAKYIKPEKEEVIKPSAPKAPGYVDPMGITDKKLDFGLWYIEHLAQLKKLLKIFLIIVSVIGWGYFFFGFFYYIFIGMKEDQALIDNMVKTKTIDHSYIESNQANDLIVGDVQVLSNGSAGSYDLIVEIENPNSRHWGEVDYNFRVNGKDGINRSGFILPGEKKFFLSLSEDLGTEAYTAEIVIKKASWHPIKTKEIPDWQKFYNERLAIEIKDAKFTSTDSRLLEEKYNMANVEFEAFNNSPYNYWSVDFIILVYQGERIISASSFAKESFMSGQSYKINLNWPTTVISASSVKVIPELNIIKKDIYINPVGVPANSDYIR